MPTWMHGSLSRIQNRCLRTIAGGYKATPVTELEQETRVAPLALHLDMLQASARLRLKRSGRKDQTNAAIKKIRGKLKGKRGRRRRPAPTPGEVKHKWAKEIYAAEPSPEDQAAKDREAQHIKKFFKAKWKDKWEAHCAQPHRCLPAIRQLTTRTSSLKLHEGLAKAESALAVQIRTEVIGLASFLFRMRVPGVTSPACNCGYHRQTAKHVIIDRPLHNRSQLRSASGQLDFRTLTGTNTGLKKVTKWLMKTGLLKQFDWASDFLCRSDPGPKR